MKKATTNSESMKRLIGEAIQQRRRTHKLTQSQLGGSRFSKSYVSAVERGKLNPSPEALHFFARQLALPEDYFTEGLKAIFNHAEDQHSQHRGLPSNATNRYMTQNEVLTLLDTLADSIDFHQMTLPERLPLLSTQMIALLSTARQARYYLLNGLIAQKKNDLPTALRAFETALVSAPLELQPVILDQIGINLSLTEAHHTALEYHLRALTLVRQTRAGSEKDRSNLEFTLELHCADNYYTLGNYELACVAYEHASQHTTTMLEINKASWLYWHLGSARAAVANHHAATNFITQPSFTLDAVENEFKQATDCLSESLTLYRISRDQQRETIVRLEFVRALLDLHHWREQCAEPVSPDQVTSLSEIIEEQCLHILRNNLQPHKSIREPTIEIKQTTLFALAYLVQLQVSCSRQTNCTQLYLHKAANLHQQILNALAGSHLSWQAIQQALLPRTFASSAALPALPRLPDTTNMSAHYQQTYALAMMEIYLAAGEIVEALNEITPDEQAQAMGYQHANQFFKLAHIAAEQAAANKAEDIKHTSSFYQRCILIYQNRLQKQAKPDQEADRLFLDILKTGFNRLYIPHLPSE